MLIWGGRNNASPFNDGARYNPTNNSWSPITTAGAPSVRYRHSAVWTGNELIIWGGWNDTSNLGDGARWNRQQNTWTRMSQANGPAGRRNHTAVWTGDAMLVFGGTDATVPTDTRIHSYVPPRAMSLYLRP